jgi:hypothetical protein
VCNRVFHRRILDHHQIDLTLKVHPPCRLDLSVFVSHALVEGGGAAFSSCLTHRHDNMWVHKVLIICTELCSLIMGIHASAPDVKWIHVMTLVYVPAKISYLCFTMTQNVMCQVTYSDKLGTMKNIPAMTAATAIYDVKTQMTHILSATFALYFGPKIKQSLILCLNQCREGGTIIEECPDTPIQPCFQAWFDTPI